MSVKRACLASSRPLWASLPGASKLCSSTYNVGRCHWILERRGQGGYYFRKINESPLPPTGRQRALSRIYLGKRRIYSTRKQRESEPLGGEPRASHGKGDTNTLLGGKDPISRFLHPSKNLGRGERFLASLSLSLGPILLLLIPAGISQTISDRRRSLSLSLRKLGSTSDNFSQFLGARVRLLQLGQEGEK